MMKLNLDEIKRLIGKSAPQIMTATGIVSMAASVFFAVKVTPKAVKIIEAKREAEGEVKPIDIVKSVGKLYIPSAVFFTTGAGLLIGASVEQANRTASLASAYSISQTALREYKEQVRESTADDGVSIKDALAKKHIDAADTNEILLTQTGETLCYESISGRYFKSDIEYLKRGVNKINQYLVANSTQYVSLNDFYEQIGLEPTRMGYDLGWRAEHGLVEIEYSSQLTPTGVPCLVIDYATYPIWEYDKWL